jgi:glyoxylase-like metal-dependent hydrolase (beta-lactamase superfamily II)
VPELRNRLAERGLELRDLKHLLLSHIHLDHAGATGTLVREHPELQVHVSEIGAPHLVDPERLERSARRLYGDEFDRLWGELVPVPEENINLVGDDVLGLECFPTPGHASHHVCYRANDGTLYAGDATGVRIQPSEAVLPPTPPPEFDLATWQTTLDEIERREPQRLALIHFGVADDPEPHIADLRARLERWTKWVGEGMSRDDFVQAGQEDLGPDRDAYEHAMPLWQSYAGLERYWQKKLENAAGP